MKIEQTVNKQEVVMEIERDATSQTGHLADIGRRELDRAYPEPAEYTREGCEHVPGMELRGLLPCRWGEDAWGKVAVALSRLSNDDVLRLAAGLRMSINLQCDHLESPQSSGDRKDVEFDLWLLDEVLAHLGGRTMSTHLAA